MLLLSVPPLLPEPLPRAGGAALASLLDGLPEEALGLCQIAQPWLATADGADLPGGVVPPEAVLAGIIGGHALTRGCFLSAAGTPVAATRLPQALPDPDGRTARFETGAGRYRCSPPTETPSRDPVARHAAVRRLTALLLRSAARLGAAAVFEPSGERLWRDVEIRLGLLLERCSRPAGCAVAMPREAFFVRCDRSTMTPADIDNGPRHRRGRVRAGPAGRADQGASGVWSQRPAALPGGVPCDDILLQPFRFRVDFFQAGKDFAVRRAAPAVRRGVLRGERPRGDDGAQDLPRGRPQCRRPPAAGPGHLPAGRAEARRHHDPAPLALVRAGRRPPLRGPPRRAARRARARRRTRSKAPGRLEWRMRDCLPTRFRAPTFQAKDHEVAVEELQFVHEGLSLEADAAGGRCNDRARTATLTAISDLQGRPIPREASAAPVKVHFNPEKLELTITNAMEQNRNRRRREPPQLVTESTAKLAVELLFDTTDTGSDVREDHLPGGADDAAAAGTEPARAAARRAVDRAVRVGQLRVRGLHRQLQARRSTSSRPRACRCARRSACR